MGLGQAFRQSKGAATMVTIRNLHQPVRGFNCSSGQAGTARRGRGRPSMVSMGGRTGASLLRRLKHRDIKHWFRMGLNASGTFNGELTLQLGDEFFRGLNPNSRRIRDTISTLGTLQTFRYQSGVSVENGMLKLVAHQTIQGQTNL